MDFADIKNKTISELQTLLSEWREDLRALRFKAHSRELKQIEKLHELKKMIAQTTSVLADKLKAK